MLILENKNILERFIYFIYLDILFSGLGTGRVVMGEQVVVVALSL